MVSNDNIVSLSSYQKYQNNLLEAAITWTNRLLLAMFFVNCVWFLWDFWGTLIQNTAGLMIVAAGWWAVKEVKRGSKFPFSEAYAYSTIIVSSLFTLVLGQASIANGALGAMIFILIATIIGSENPSTRWGYLGVISYLVALTIRILHPALDFSASSADIISLYLFPPLFILLFSYTSRGVAKTLKDSLTASEEALLALKNTNEQLETELTERHRIEKELHKYREELEHLVQERTAELEAANDQLFEEIEARKQVEEQIRASLGEKEVLLKEIHHRVKNNLQIISGLLDLQSGYVEDKRIGQLFKESQNRIQSMALIHERLYKAEDLARINLAEYIETLTDQLLQSYHGIGAIHIDLRLDITPISLSIDKAVPCGLIINELVSNAMKHAFSDNEQSGEIWIEGKAKPDCQLVLVIGDNGVGIPSEIDFQRVQSLGLTLVTTLVKQIRGNIELHRKEGTEFKITFVP